MRKSTFFLFGIITVLIGCLFYTLISPKTSAQKNTRLQWEYATVKAVYSLGSPGEKTERIYGITEICYLQTTGCKRQEIKHELDYGGFLQERALSENSASRRQAGLIASETAFQKTLAQFGNEGWEILGAPDLKFDFVSVDEYNKYDNKSLLFYREDTRTVYFKRLKTQ